MLLWTYNSLGNCRIIWYRYRPTGILGQLFSHPLRTECCEYEYLVFSSDNKPYTKVYHAATLLQQLYVWCIIVSVVKIMSNAVGCVSLSNYYEISILTYRWYIYKQTVTSYTVWFCYILFQILTHFFRSLIYTYFFVHNRNAHALNFLGRFSFVRNFWKIVRYSFTEIRGRIRNNSPPAKLWISGGGVVTYLFNSLSG